MKWRQGISILSSGPLSEEGCDGQEGTCAKECSREVIGFSCDFQQQSTFFLFDFSFHSHFHWHTLTVSFDASKYY